MLKDNINSIILEDLEAILEGNIPWEKLKNKTILITGANGFIPSYFVYSLLYLNDTKQYDIKIIALVRNREKAFSKFKSLLNRSDLTLLIQDVTEPIKIENKIDFIIHAASKASPKYFGIDPVGIINANVVGTNNLLSFSIKNNLESFLFVSSGEVYGQIKNDQIPTKENQYGYIDSMNVRSCYSESKRLAETLCVSYFSQYGIPIKIARPFHTYGPGLELSDGRVYADFINDILSNRNLIINSDGNAQRAFCYISDVISGCFHILLIGENGKAYNVGNQEAEVSIKQLAEKLCELFPEKKLKAIIKNRETQPNYLKSPIERNCPDTNFLRKLGWKSSITIEAGFTRTINSYL